ncbi:MAG: hypothetical protein JWO32_1004 [Bacteroidetes bacterium]|nr:hypothetical protein [Bacteroidota bacterium]
MNTELNSSHLKVIINQKGAELSSVTDKNNIEFIWQADKEVWPRHAPVLFPIVGKLKGDQAFYEGKTCKLSQHGFARDMDFELISSSSNSATFQLASSAETINKYPFEFVFEITYQLNESELITTYKVKNPGSAPLLFSVGAHPGFNCPLNKDETFEDYFLEFETNTLSQTLLQDGLLSENISTLNLENNQLPLSVALFDKDALVFENDQINKISLRSKKSKHSVTMTCQGWPYFGIWTKKGNNRFVCLEPWQGITDGINSMHQFSDKKGILHLDAGKEYSCAFSCTFC